MRIAALQRTNLHFDEPRIIVDPDEGALHEVRGKHVLGPSKTTASVRTVHLPPSLWCRRFDDARRGTAALFHDPRRTQKTRLIEDDVPEVAQAARLGHRMPGARGLYSHVSQAMIDHLLAGLQRRWEQTGSTGPANTTEYQRGSRSFAPRLLPEQQNGPSAKITDRPSDQCI